MRQKLLWLSFCKWGDCGRWASCSQIYLLEHAANVHFPLPLQLWNVGRSDEYHLQAKAVKSIGAFSTFSLCSHLPDVRETLKPRIENGESQCLWMTGHRCWATLLTHTGPRERQEIRFYCVKPRTHIHTHNFCCEWSFIKSVMPVNLLSFL